VNYYFYTQGLQVKPEQIPIIPVTKPPPPTTKVIIETTTEHPLGK
jgi:hypothetical protein